MIVQVYHRPVAANRAMDVCRLMSIDMFLAPVSTRTYATMATVKPKIIPPPRKPPRWEDLASEERWKEALMAYLQQNWRGGSGFWHVINSVAAEAMPECRWQMRDYTRQVLEALMELVREKRVLRFKRKWVAALDLREERVALEDIPKGRLVRI